MGNPCYNQNTRNPHYNDSFPLKATSLTEDMKYSNMCVSSENQDGLGPRRYLCSQNNEGAPFYRNVPTTHIRTFLLLSTTFLMYLIKNTFFGGFSSACFYCHKERIIYGKNNNSHATLTRDTDFSPLESYLKIILKWGLLSLGASLYHVREFT